MDGIDIILPQRKIKLEKRSNLFILIPINCFLYKNIKGIKRNAEVATKGTEYSKRVPFKAILT
ncbi:MAG: hypothetical protein WBH31_14645 [Promethearchaeia archaeon]